MIFDTTQNSYIALRSVIAEKTTPIIAWIGAGLSAKAKFPNWASLKNVLLKELLNKANSGFPKEEKDKLIYTHDSIKKNTNYWVDFSRIKKVLGNATYRETIKGCFKDGVSVKVPVIYEKLWQLRLKGVINLNIDRMATRAYESLPGKNPITEFCGKDIKDYFHILKSPYPFMLNLHGIYENYSSWVFTHNELRDLFINPGYSQFIQNCFASNTVIFVGISADDIAVGGHLENLAKQSLNTGTHYWITDRTDAKTDKWAENNGIRIIRYDSKNDHIALEECLDDIMKYIPVDEIAPPITPKLMIQDFTGLPEPIDLVKFDAEAIREVLNSKAKEILAYDKDYKEYQNFCKKYDEAIYRAWYTTIKPGHNKLLEYTLTNFHTKGAFGRVYKALDKEGNQIAIKILLEEERNKDEFLQSFRRGVRSMNILAERNVRGMVKYLDAYEIPAFVVMEWIDGPNLKEAVEARLINGWFTILKISLEITTIISTAHMLPERVLHRDIRPPNIMLKNFYNDSNNWEIVLLDFDLSWHIGANEKSVLDSTTASSFLAPEQIKKNVNVSTRNSAVDSFALGMTMYYIISGRSPYPAEHNHSNWMNTVLDATKRNISKNWQSLPYRYGRLILNATRDIQSQRWDMTQIKNELARLFEANLNPESILFTDLIAEEIVARSSYKTNYYWCDNELCINLNLPSGIKIKVIGEESTQNIIVNIEWHNLAVAENRKISKWLPQAKDQVSKQLRHYLWDVKNCRSSGQSLFISAEIKQKVAIKTLNSLGNCIDEIVKLLNFK